ncbi:flagellar biosynthesis repressor FlbT [Pseudoroseicyclus aestuarii]|uniref:Flagellar protein FlbT n=1 Tax=Pseudoroseicyclus aestuarii TaxID=1795041 RepID=A0A318SRS3_9RHOB|nr:flagellar biosynthesis repressor FlbT [Pseudoroseicyclus aestuarii]PYE84383.1 flagellar protein FlbT [Pseudoroseicyclus aestuarii]
MALKLTLKPNERIIVNGCALRNSGRRHVMIVESQADVVRGQDLLDAEAAATPAAQVYFLVQTALTRSDLREALAPAIRDRLATLSATSFASAHRGDLMEAATFIAMGDFYKALRALRPMMREEAAALPQAEDSAA